MKVARKVWIAGLSLLCACDAVEEVTAPAERDGLAPSASLIEAGTAYPAIDAQVARLYEFNNCLTGLPPYNASPNCQAADLSYDVAGAGNLQLAWIFDWGVTTSKAQALLRLDTYISSLDIGFMLGRVSCRGRYAARGVALTLRGIINSITPGLAVDLSALPQPVAADLNTLNLFAGANYNGTPCGAAPGPAFPAAGNYTLFATNTSCSDAGRSLELAGPAFYATNSVHSNASARITGSAGTIWDALTYRCTLTNTGLDNSFGSGPSAVGAQVATPLAFAPSDFPCTYTRTGNWNLDGNGVWWVGGTALSRRLRPGVYCSTGNITLGVYAVRGDVTFVSSGTITITGDLVSLRAYLNNVLLFSTSNASTAISLSGNDHSLAGYLYDPSGGVQINGDDFTLNGAVVGNRIRLIGAGLSIVTRTP